VTQSYGNCPKYINIRDLTAEFDPTETNVSANRSGLNDADRVAIRAADMFLIASYYDAGLGDSFEGADMSHRGGTPGFVRVAGDTLIIPDYFGNNLFNTLGNLVMNPATALLFVDFETGDTRHLSGTAQVITDTARLTEYPKALRLLEVTVTGVIFTISATPLRWTLRELSPYNPDPFSEPETR
jgi:predicted pyridoxine 5'-phosphate oxidase superfamily flavin-nucleotide-binding protein